MAQMIVSAAPAADRTSVKRAALFAGLLGVLLLWVAGFAQPAFLHNAAHDSRHALSFPCH